MANKQKGVGIAAPAQEVWEILFAKALTLIDEIEKHGTKDPFWTFGGGTVLMLRYQHRKSKDIDIFVPDPSLSAISRPGSATWRKAWSRATRNPPAT